MLTEKISRISGMHYLKLGLRSLLFVLATILYIVVGKDAFADLTKSFEQGAWLLIIIWIIYAFEMVCRFFPSKLESMGCQKQFKRNYQPTNSNKMTLLSWKRTALVFASWFSLNAIIGLLHYFKLIDGGILVLISLFYGVCDMICILFFCPFQTWMMKNRCCGVCRIYNWDFAMMFTPYLFIPHLYTWSLLILSLILLIRWEVTYHLHPERFSEDTNASLKCANCKEKLCLHKKQLWGFWEKNKKRIWHI